MIGLNHWEEGLIALEDALKSLDKGKQASSEDTEFILRILFKNITYLDTWKNSIKALIELFNKYNSSSALSQGLVQSIAVLMSEIVSDEAVQIWLEAWQELAGDYPEFDISLRLLDIAVRYRESKSDRRILLELPIEERKLLQEVLEIE